MSEQTIADGKPKRKRRKPDWAAIQSPSAKWGRIPTATARSGLSRSTLYKIIAPGGEVESAVIKEKGARTGVRLINLESLEKFIRANAV